MFRWVRLMAAVLAISAWAQTPVAIPRFEDYPATEIFKGTPAIPQITTPCGRI